VKRHKRTGPADLATRYPPSEPCSCEVCLAYCARPGWWTVEEAECALDAGYARRMMLEVSPERRFGVLSPAFKGCEATFALQRYAKRGCTFLTAGGLCELFETGHEPLECRFCHHDRRGEGPRCHADVERSWDSPAGRALVVRWSKLVGVFEYFDSFGLAKLKA